MGCRAKGLWVGVILPDQCNPAWFTGGQRERRDGCFRSVLCVPVTDGCSRELGSVRIRLGNARQLAGHAG